MRPAVSALSRTLVPLALALSLAGCAPKRATFVAPSRPAEFSLAGVPWGVSADSVSALMPARGYAYNKTDEDGDLWFDGRLFRWPSRVYAFMGQQRLVKFRVLINTPDENAIATYQTARAELIKQYGQPRETTEEYDAPYAKGDGKSMKAVKEGKARMETYWIPSGSRTSHVSIEVTSNLAVLVDYDSPAWDKEMVRRRNAGK